MSVLGNYFGRRPERDYRAPVIKVSQAARELNKQIISTDYIDNGQQEFVHVDTQLLSLMDSVKDQAVTLQCDHAKFAADLDMRLEILANRMSTLQPLLGKSITQANEREQAIARLLEAQDELKRRMSDADRDLAHFRPLATKLGDELSAVQTQLAEKIQHCAVLEADNKKAHSTINEYFQRVATAEGLRQRALEENAAFVQKLNANDSTIQSMLRESANLKSEVINLSSELERKDAYATAIAQKLSIAADEQKRAIAALSAAEAQADQTVQQMSSRLSDAEERCKRATEVLNEREKRIYDLEVKQSAIQSKADYLNRTNERLREELRRHLNHIGNIESSNRQLLDSLSRATAQLEHGEPPVQHQDTGTAQSSNILTLPRISEARDAATSP
jgi:chromosome segregation ATPase